MSVNVQQAKLDRAFFRAARSEALVKQGGRCVYCKDRLSASTVTADHIRAKIRGGRDHKENILAACYECNRTKSALPIATFKRLIKNPPPDVHWRFKTAHIRRRINKRTEKAVKRILASVGIAA